MIGAQSPVRKSKNATLPPQRVEQLRKEARPMSKNPRAKRRNLLRRELAKYNVEFREDSKLCQRFIGGENISIREIANILYEMTYLSKHTGYNDLMNILVTAHRCHCAPHEVKQMESDVYLKLSVQAKHMALSDNNISIIEHCCPGFCVADEIGSNQIILPHMIPSAYEEITDSMANAGRQAIAT